MAEKQQKAGEMSFLEHLEVLRWHLVRSIAAIVILAIIAFIFKNIVFDVILIAPKTPEFPTNQFLCEVGQRLNVQRLCINSRPFDLQTVKMAEHHRKPYCRFHLFIPLYLLGVLAFH